MSLFCIENCPSAVIFLSWVAVIFFGLCIGSFANVVIHRLPIMLEREWKSMAHEALGLEEDKREPYNLAIPRSKCPSCEHLITWYENIPVISWLFLRGKCASCSAPIHWQYPAVELLFAVIAVFSIHNFGLTYTGIVSAVIVWLLLILTVIDYKTYLLPDAITLPMVWAGLLIAAFFPVSYSPSSHDALLGASIGYLSLFSINTIYMMVRKKTGMGNGDFKLFAAIGALFGVHALFPVILAASLSGLLVAITTPVLAKKNAELQIPFGPYLAFGAVAYLFFSKFYPAYFFI